MIETGAINRLADDLVTAIGEHDTGFGFVRQAMICVELDNGPSTTFLTVSADDRPWVQIAFLEATARHLEARLDEAREDGWDQ